MIIELSGTPGSGKDSIIELLKKNEYSNLETIDEAEHFKEPYDFDHDIALKMLWSILNTYSTFIQVVNEKQMSDSRLIIFNRGLFDRIAWARLIRTENKEYCAVSEDIEKYLKKVLFLNRMDLVFLMLTSYEKVKERREKYQLRPNKTFRVVNCDTIDNLNKIYRDLYDEFKSDFPFVLLDDSSQNLSLEQKLTIVKSNIDNTKIPVLNSGVLSKI